MQNFELYFNLCRVLNVDIHIIEYDKLQKCVSHHTYVCITFIAPSLWETSLHFFNHQIIKYKAEQSKVRFFNVPMVWKTRKSWLRFSCSIGAAPLCLFVDYRPC